MINRKKKTHECLTNPFKMLLKTSPGLSYSHSYYKILSYTQTQNYFLCLLYKGKMLQRGNQANNSRKRLKMHILKHILKRATK